MILLLLLNLKTCECVIANYVSISNASVDFCSNTLQLGDAFVGYQEDTPAAVVFQAYHYLKATEQCKIDDKMSEDQKTKVK